MLSETAPSRRDQCRSERPPPAHAAPVSNGVEHRQRLRDVRGTKTGGSLTSPTRTPSPGAPPPEGRGQPEGAQQVGGKGACNTRRSESGTHPPMCASHPGTSPATPPGGGTRPGSGPPHCRQWDFPCSSQPVGPRRPQGPPGTGRAAPQALHNPPPVSAGSRTESQVRPRSMRMRPWGMGAVARSSNAWRWSRAFKKPP